mmetsp:Transcript_9006/g.30983  ORF Transcript_9006/g.30983 Transcript_9006/m.30983 type:complete len:265 (-) Transcript_9006:1173-1967(-)
MGHVQGRAGGPLEGWRGAPHRAARGERHDEVLPHGRLQTRRLFAAPFLPQEVGNEEGGCGTGPDELGDGAQPDHRRPDGRARRRGRGGARRQRPRREEEGGGGGALGTKPAAAWRLRPRRGRLGGSLARQGRQVHRSGRRLLHRGVPAAGSAALSRRISGAGDRVQAWRGLFRHFRADRERRGRPGALRPALRRGSRQQGRQREHQRPVRGPESLRCPCGPLRGSRDHQQAGAHQCRQAILQGVPRARGLAAVLPGALRRHRGG